MELLELTGRQATEEIDPARRWCLVDILRRRFMKMVAVSFIQEEPMQT